MRHKQLRIAATTFVLLLALIVPAILFIRSQAAQTTGQTDDQSHRVLIEKNQIIGASTVPEITLGPSTPAPLDELTSTQPPRFSTAIQRFERSGIRDAAFSGEVQVETVQPLREGGTTTRKSTYLIYRDHEGRTRCDLISDSRPRTSVINDPVASSAYVVEHRTSTARKVSLALSSQPEAQPGLVQSRARGTAPGFVNLDHYNSKVESERAASPSIKKEQLGQREIQGVLTDGTRLVQTIRRGESLIDITTEEWYSPELQTIVAITISDPRFGQSEYRLVNIVRGDPSPTLFAIPQGYKIKD